MYRIGTTSGRTLSIEEGTNAGLSGWGWCDEAWGAPAGDGGRRRGPARKRERADGV
jgi:hypothetical protein